MPEVIEHAEEQDDIEGADALRRQIHDIDIDVFDPRFERLPRELKSGLRAPPGGAPRVMVRGDDARGAAALALEREKSVPRTDVEDRAAFERCREVQPGQS